MARIPADAMGGIDGAVDSSPRVVAKKKEKKSASSGADTGRDNYSDFSELDNQSGVINSHRETGRIIDSVYQFVSARSATLFSSLI